MTGRLLITLLESDMAPRFDLANEVLIAVWHRAGHLSARRTIVLTRESAEDLCQLILNEDITAVICGAIEEDYYDYLVWKKIDVFDSVIGPWESALDRFTEGVLESGTILFDRKGGIEDG